MIFYRDLDVSDTHSTWFRWIYFVESHHVVIDGRGSIFRGRLYPNRQEVPATKLHIIHATVRHHILFSYNHNLRSAAFSPKMKHYYRDNSPIADHYINGIYIPATLIISITALTKIEWTPIAVAISVVLAGYQIYTHSTSVLRYGVNYLLTSDRNHQSAQAR